MMYFGIIGYGNIGRRHALTIGSIPNAQVVAVSDTLINETELTGLPFYLSHEEMLAAHPEIEVVCVCSPNGLHATHGLACIRAGKHVLIEKPLALTKKEAEDLIFYSLRQNVKVFCVMQNRFTPVATLLKSLVERGSLGRLLELQMYLCWNRGEVYYRTDGNNHLWRGSKELDGGPLFTQFSHFIDLIYWLFGDIRILHVTKRNLNHPYMPQLDDSGIVTFEFAGDALGTLHYSINAPRENIISTFTIVGSEGAVSVQGQYLDKITYLLSKDHDSIPELEPQLIPGHELTIRNVISAIRNNEMISTNVLEGMKVVEMIENIYSFNKREE